MPRKSSYGKFIIPAGEVGSFTLCAEAWRLKSLTAAKRSQTESHDLGEKLHSKWAEGHEEVEFLTRGVRLVITMVIITLVFFELMQCANSYFMVLRHTAPRASSYIDHLDQFDTEVWIIGALLLSMLAVLNRIIDALHARKAESGLERRSSAVSVDGSNTLPGRNYVSEIQGIAGRPDAVIWERSYLIPVERKPLARKLRDRHVAQLLIYMRLIEEFEGKKPPYGYLILGPNCRKIRIDNTEERQKWVQAYLDEMKAILAGAPAKPSPHPKKCRKCEVRDHCTFRMDLNSALVPNDEIVAIGHKVKRVS